MIKNSRSVMKNFEVKNAATIIVLRGSNENSKVLMGQRGEGASFMPNKFVFPGGAVDKGDSGIIPDDKINKEMLLNLKMKSESGIESAIVAAGIRELWEETGLILGSFSKHTPTTQHKSWEEFFKNGYQPNAKNMDLIFRAITPPGRTRRFDARFFLVNSENIHGDLDDFSNASGELSHLQWIGLTAAESLDLPIITQIVLKEVYSIMNGSSQSGYPFYYHDGGTSHLERLRRN